MWFRNKSTALAVQKHATFAIVSIVSLAVGLLGLGQVAVTGSITPYITLAFTLGLIILVPEVFFRKAFDFSIIGWIMRRG